MELNICHLYPDILNLYGERGNILCMKKRLDWRGIGVTVTGVSIGQALEASAYDLLFVGGGQDFEQEVLLGDLAGAKTEELKSAIEDGLPVLAICLATLAAGTIAYFNSEGKAHNVITTGGVEIAVQEWADEERTKPFEDVTGVMPETTVT